MPSLPARSRPAFIAGAFALAGFLAVTILAPRAWTEFVRQQGFDLILSASDLVRGPSPGAAADLVRVVDIDRRSLEILGPWPWPRDTMARLIEAVSAAQPRIIAIDVLFAGPDTRSPAALARQLGALVNRPALGELAASLPDGDKALAKAIGATPTILGFVLDPNESGDVPGAPVLLRGPESLNELWRAGGVVAPAPELLNVSAGIGALSLPGDSDGTVRRVPLLVGVGEMLRPGLALEAVRVATASSSYLLTTGPQMLLTGDVRLGLPSDATLRLIPINPRRHVARTISAIDIVEGRETARLQGTLVLIGGSAPELGGLRQTAADPLTPSVQIQADAIDQIFAGRAPQSIPPLAEVSILVGVGAIALAGALLLAPLLGAALTFAATILSWIASLALSLQADALFDPLTVSIGAAIVYMTASIASYSATRRREARVRRRFEQHLAPAVVQRIVDEPHLIKLTGERREVTALFTDIEGFTAMTNRADPQTLVAVLDGYIEGIAEIVIAHGGMVDKIVGDAVHALFNVPVDLEDHSRRSVACAIAIKAWTGEYRARPMPSSIGFGRTRIGIETGQAIVGDFGLHAKLDYTAHGDAVNAAARFEAANKDLGSTICVGPVAASRCDAGSLRPLGTIIVRGRGDAPVPVYEPWSDDASPAWREKYLAALRMIALDPAAAAATLDELAAECPHDAALRPMTERLRRPPS